MEIINGEFIAHTLSNLGLPIEFVKMEFAPQVILYHYNLLNFNVYNKLKQSKQKLEMILHEKIEIVSSGIAHFALEFRRRSKEIVRTVNQSELLKNLPRNSILFGYDTNNTPIVADLEKAIHILIAGCTGSGKSSALNSYITELACYNSPQELKMVLIDCKRTEFCVYERLPHLLTNIAYDIDSAERILTYLITEMERRYKYMAEKHIDKNDGTFPTICVFIDELGNLVLQSENCKQMLIRLLQTARASDIHFVMGNQGVRASVLSGLMLLNIPTKLILKCSSNRESVLALNHGGAEKLLGRGDAILVVDGDPIEHRLQVPYITKQEITEIIE